MDPITLAALLGGTAGGAALRVGGSRALGAGVGGLGSYLGAKSVSERDDNKQVKEFEDYIQSERSVEWDKKISKVEIENDLSNFSNDELYELANYYKYPEGYKYLDSERSEEYSNRIWNEIKKRKNPFTKDLPLGNTMGTGDFR
jgi:hypothetical protein